MFKLNTWMMPPMFKKLGHKNERKHAVFVSWLKQEIRKIVQDMQTDTSRVRDHTKNIRPIRL